MSPQELDHSHLVPESQPEEISFSLKAGVSLDEVWGKFTALKDSFLKPQTSLEKKQYNLLAESQIGEVSGPLGDFADLFDQGQSFLAALDVEGYERAETLNEVHIPIEKQLAVSMGLECMLQDMLDKHLFSGKQRDMVYAYKVQLREQEKNQINTWLLNNGGEDAPEEIRAQAQHLGLLTKATSVGTMTIVFLTACSGGVAPTISANPTENPPAMTETVEAAVAINPIERLTGQEFKDQYTAEYTKLTTDLQTLVPAWKSKAMDIEYFSFNREENGNKVQAGWATIISVDGIKYLGRPSADGMKLTVSPLCYTATDEGVSYFTVDETGTVVPFMEATTSGTIAHLPDGTTVESSVIMENPNAIGGKVASPVDMDLFTSTSFDVNTGILTGKTVDGKDMTWDGTKWNEVRIEDKLPAYAEWMQAHVEGLVAQQEGDVFYLVRELADGRQIKVFEYADNEWRPSYQSMKEFVREDKTFDLEAAMQNMFMRMGPVADVDGQPAMSVNMEDYQRFAQEAQKIWGGLSGLKPAKFSGGDGGTRTNLSAEIRFDLSIIGNVGQWQLIGWAKNPAGPESVFVIATSDGPVALLNVGEIGYTHLNNQDSIEEWVAELADQTSTQFGTSDVIMMFLDPTPNPRFEGTVDADKVELMRAYIRGMGIDARKTFADMRGPASAQRAALNNLFQHGPVLASDVSADR